MTSEQAEQLIQAVLILKEVVGAVYSVLVCWFAYQGAGVFVGSSRALGNMGGS